MKKTKAHWADISMSIHDRIQRNPRRVALFAEGGKVKSSNEGTELYFRQIERPSLIGIYDQRASQAEIEADILDAML